MNNKYNISWRDIIVNKNDMQNDACGHRMSDHLTDTAVTNSDWLTQTDDAIIWCTVTDE